MQEYIQKRVLEICTYILETQATVRQAAQVFGVSKSTVHKDMTERLPSLNKELARQVKKYWITINQKGTCAVVRLREKISVRGKTKLA